MMSPDDLQTSPSGDLFLYFGVTNIALPDLPIGARFAIVHSPSAHSSTRRYWRRNVYEVGWCLRRGDWERVYLEVETRALADNEITAAAEWLAEVER